MFPLKSEDQRASSGSSSTSAASSHIIATFVAEPCFETRQTPGRPLYLDMGMCMAPPWCNDTRQALPFERPLPLIVSEDYEYNPFVVESCFPEHVYELWQDVFLATYLSIRILLIVFVV